MTIRRALILSLALIGGSPAAAEGPAPLSEFTDCEGCPAMVAVPTGTFVMGATPAEEAMPFIAYNVPQELPRREVTISRPFAIGKFEVTVAEFDLFVRETGTEVGGICSIRLAESGPLAGKVTGTLHPESAQFSQSPFLTYITDGSHLQPGLPVTEMQPAVCVSRSEIKAYLDWLTKKTGRTYRLPSEAEWEYAARAGTGTVAFWGDDLSKACEYANFGDSGSGYQAGMMAPCSEAIRPEWTAEVGSYKPNPWGLHDMLGNVQEMIEDCWHENYQGAPSDGSAWTKSGCQLFVARGGDYELLYVSMRAAERLFWGYGPEAGDPQGPDAAFNSRSNVAGFRVAADLE